MSSDWLEVMDVAHRLGLYSSATMMFGHVETMEDRIEHLERLRQQQEKSLSYGKGHFTAFICWTFQAENTKLKAPRSARMIICARRRWAASTSTTSRTSKARGSRRGLEIGQVALKYGANDLGSIMIEENVVSQAGTTFSMTVPDMHRLIKDLGYDRTSATTGIDW